MVAYEQVKNHNTKKVCRVLKLNRSSLYLCAKTRPEGKFKKENDILKREILRIYNKNDGIHGAPKIRIELLNPKALGIKSVVIKKFSLFVSKLLTEVQNFKQTACIHICQNK